MIHRLLILAAIVISITNETWAFSRKFSYELNPNCGSSCEHYHLNKTEFNNIMHVRGDGPTDTLHFVWSSVGAPTILIARTNKGASLSVDWKKLYAKDSSGAVKFNGKVHYSFATVFSKLYEYVDVHNKAKLIRNNDTITYHLDKLTWNNVNETLKLNSKEVSATFVTSDASSSSMLSSGHINLKVSVYDTTERMSYLPHQKWTPNSTIFDFTINGVKASDKKSRFSTEMIFFSYHVPDKRSGAIDYSSSKSIDDEYTPSVFKTFLLSSSEAAGSRASGYMQWKPISYSTSERKYLKSTTIDVESFNNSERCCDVPTSVAKSFYGKNLRRVRMANMILDFGLAGEKDFYSSTNYSTWTAALGNGVPPKDEMSLTVILVVTVGLGLPVLMFVVGGIYIVVKKFKGRRQDDQVTLVVDA